MSDLKESKVQIFDTLERVQEVDNIFDECKGKFLLENN